MQNDKHVGKILYVGIMLYVGLNYMMWQNTKTLPIYV